MKKLFALAALVLGLASCQKDVNSLEVNVGEQETVVTVSLPEVTRANSAESGWENTEGTLRVIMQIFDENGNTTDAMRFDQETISFNAKRIVNYNVRLVPGHKYTFVAWADQGAGYFNVDNLKNVTFVDGAWTAMNEGIDAYTATETVEAGNSIRSINLVLTRPFAKVRVVATDINDVLAQGWVPTTAIATYQETVPVSFNAFAGVVGETAPVANPVRHVSYNGQYTDNAGEMTLFADYLYVPTSGTAKFEFAINGVDNNGNAIAIRNDIVFNTPIPAVRNKLTTIKGDILTNGSNIKVEVDEELPEYVMEIVDVETPEQLQEALENTEVGEIILQEDITLDGSLVFGAPATTASTFATRANTDLPGRNITIDGNGKTLKSTVSGKNVRVIDFTSATNGASLTLKNLTIENTASWVERIVNYNTNGTLTLENVKIINAEGCKLNYAINLPASSDNAKVVIKDSEIWANANALNLWGENTVANISRSKLYIVDSNNIEGYSVVALNNDGENAAHNSVINVEGGEIKVKYEGEGETKPSSALRDATVGSQINISKTTEIVGEVKIPVANVIYEGYNEFYSFTTLQDAIDKVQEDNKGTIRLIKDVEATKVIEISDNVTIDGNGKTISTSDNRIVRITESNAKVTISNVNFVSSAVMNYPSDVRGVSIDPSLSNVELTLNNCSIDFTDETTNDWTYAVNIAGNGTGHKVTVNGGTYEGANVINAWGANNTITVKNATLNSLYPDSTLYCGVCISTLNCQGTSVYAEGNTFNGKNAKASDLGTGNTLDAKNNVDNTTLFVANGLYKDTNKAYVVTNAEGLAKLNTMMADKTAGKNVVVNLTANIDFTGKTWTPVDSHADTSFTFTELNGNGYTLSNLTINGQAMFTRFAGTGDVVIKNITFDNATVNSNGTINTSILTVQSYQNVLLDNVDVKNSSITGGYKVAPLIATVYNENPSTTVTATLKNCDVENTTVKATSYDFCTTGMVAFVYAGDNDAITFENCTVSNVKLYAPNVYTAHAAVYTTGSETLYNEVEGVTVTNVTFENI